MGHRICTKAVHPNRLTAFVACRLIPLDKQPGVRPIGIGEVSWRIVAKAVLRLVDMDIWEACGACKYVRAVREAVRLLFMLSDNFIVIQVHRLFPWWMLQMHLILLTDKLHSSCITQHSQTLPPTC